MPEISRKNKQANTNGKKPSLRKKTRPTEQASKSRGFRDHISEFVTQVESLSKATELTISTVSDSYRKSSQAFLQFIAEHGINTSDSSGKRATSFKLNPHNLTQFEKHIKNLKASSLAVRNVPSIFFCSLIHQYDAYLGRLIHTAFCVKPELLNASQRQISFTELVALSSVEAARDHLIEKEVETVIRDSHVGHFDWMETRFGLSLHKDLSVWPKFIEMTERRNLFVHCDGIVSSQYLTVCKKQGVLHEKPIKVGEQLVVTTEYFSKAVDCILEVGVKLGHVLWRKLQPDMLVNADEALHITTYEFLSEERYPLVKLLLSFAVDTLKKQASDQIRRLNLINLAIAQYFSGEKDVARKLIASQDWSACEDKFKLAVAVLQNSNEEAVRIMKRIGTNGEITREHYSSWPLFKEFRHSKEFLNAYKVLFGEGFVLPETEVKGALEKISTKPTKASNEHK